MVDLGLLTDEILKFASLVPKTCPIDLYLVQFVITEIF